jgi:hypothetical protein
MRGTVAVLVAASFALTLLAGIAPAGAQATQGTGCPVASQCPRISTPTSLYFHIFDVFNNFPINTQQPNTTFFKVGGTNFPSAVAPEAGANYDFNTIYGYSTAGPVEYEFIENGQPRYHPERGLAADVMIDGAAQTPCGDTTAPICVHVYVRILDFLGSSAAPNFMPAYTFRVELKEKNVLDPTALDAGALVANGELTYHLATEDFAPLAGQAGPDGHVIKTPDENGVIEYAVPLTLAKDTITKGEGYHVRIDWFQNPSDDGANDDRAAEGYMRLVMEEGYYPRMELNILNPVFIDFIHPQVAAGILLIHTAENSPWGTYDVNVKDIKVEIFDSKDQPVQANLQRVVSQNAHVHDRHHLPAEVTYLWRYRDEGVAEGEYRIRVEVANMAATAKASGEGKFILTGEEAYGVDEEGNIVTPAPNVDEETESSPGVGIGVLLALVAVALVVRRRKA